MHLCINLHFLITSIFKPCYFLRLWPMFCDTVPSQSGWALVWFFGKNEPCANCTGWNATTIIWLLPSPFWVTKSFMDSRLGERDAVRVWLSRVFYRNRLFWTYRILLLHMKKISKKMTDNVLHMLVQIQLHISF